MDIWKPLLAVAILSATSEGTGGAGPEGGMEKAEGLPMAFTKLVVDGRGVEKAELVRGQAVSSASSGEP
jgi:hypothetical protein